MDIEIKVKNTTTALAGNPFGKKIFAEQVRSKISSVNDNVEILIPPQITNVTSSFVQGFFKYWIDAMPQSEIRKRVTIKSPYPQVVEYIWKNMRREDA